MQTTRSCPDCPNEPLELIRLLDRGNSNVQFPGLEATNAAFEPHWLKGNYPGIIGEVHGLLCRGCMQVRLYLISTEEAEALFKEAQRRASQVRHDEGRLSLTGKGGELAVSEDEQR